MRWVGFLRHSGQAAVRHVICPTSAGLGCRVPSDGDSHSKEKLECHLQQKVTWQYRLRAAAWEGVGMHSGTDVLNLGQYIFVFRLPGSSSEITKQQRNHIYPWFGMY